MPSNSIVGADDARFSGIVPEDPKPSACGVPWDWAAFCFASQDLRARLSAAWSTRAEARQRLQRVRNLPAESPPWDPYDDSGVVDAPRFVRRMEPSRQVENAAAGADRRVAELRREVAAELINRLAAGDLRAAGRRGQQRAPLEWMPRGLWLGPLEAYDPSSPARCRLRFHDVNEFWFMPHVADPSSRGLPPDVAAIGFGDPEQSAGLVTIGEPSQLVAVLRRQLVADIAEGRFRVTGRTGSEAIKRVPQVTIDRDGFDIDAGTLGAYRDVLIALPVPGIVFEDDAPTTFSTAAERRLTDWLLAQHRDGCRQSKDDWAKEARARPDFKYMSQEAFGRAWVTVRQQFPDVKQPGPRGPKHRKEPTQEID